MTSTSSAAKPATYPIWIYDGSTIEDTFGDGECAVNFIRNLRHPKSKGPMRLDLWQERIVRRIYDPGTQTARASSDRFHTVGRGARKTSLGAVLTLLHLIGPEKIAGGQIINAACDQKQATIAFDEAASILREDRRLKGPRQDPATDYKRMKHGNGTKFEAVSADGATSHGKTPDPRCSPTENPRLAQQKLMGGAANWPGEDPGQPHCIVTIDRRQGQNEHSGTKP